MTMLRKSAPLLVALALLTAPAVVAQSKTPTPSNKSDDRQVIAVVTTSKADAITLSRTKRLTNKMVRDLRLNNYQAAKLRSINEDKVRKMIAIEQKYAANPTKVDEDCKGVCSERDRELRNLLSTAQYNTYYQQRSAFYDYDKKYLVAKKDETKQPNDYAIPLGTAVDVKNPQDQQTLNQNTTPVDKTGNK